MNEELIRELRERGFGIHLFTDDESRTWDKWRCELVDWETQGGRNYIAWVSEVAMPLVDVIAKAHSIAKGLRKEKWVEALPV